MFSQNSGSIRLQVLTVCCDIFQPGVDDADILYFLMRLYISMCAYLFSTPILACRPSYFHTAMNIGKLEIIHYAFGKG